MTIFHAARHGNGFYLWAEKSPQEKANIKKQKASGGKKRPKPYPYAVSNEEIVRFLRGIGIDFGFSEINEKALYVFVPSDAGTPVFSGKDREIIPFGINCLSLSKERVLELLTLISKNKAFEGEISIGDDLAFWAEAFRFARSLAGRRQFLPGIKKEQTDYYARWEPLIKAADFEALKNFEILMPDACRSMSEKPSDRPEIPPSVIIRGFVSEMLDFIVRISNRQRSGRKKYGSAQEQWMNALCSPDGLMNLTKKEFNDLSGQIQRWRSSVSIIEESPFNFCFRLDEPEQEMTGEEEWSRAVWKVNFFLQPLDDPSLLIPAGKAWNPGQKLRRVLEKEGFDYREFILQSLGRASKISPFIEESLKFSGIDGYETDTAGAFDFLKEKALLLEQAGFTVLLPSWWGGKANKKQITASLQISPSSFSSDSFISLDDVMNFDWKLALGDEEITGEEIKMLAQFKSSLVKFRGQWIHLSADEIKKSLEFWKKKEEISTLCDLLKINIGYSRISELVPIENVETSGYIEDFFKKLKRESEFIEIQQPADFRGELRPYQKTGYSWLDFLKETGLGACLADDMGLGKTIQVLSLILKDYADGNRRPVLIICPTSVMGNWQKEASKFTPSLSVSVHHGNERTKDDGFKEEANNSDIVISSYALLYRDFDIFKDVKWRGVVLDEAQNIKNPETKQARFACRIESDYRIALTGTPVENHVGDLWSIMEFLNPGFLGTQNEFRNKFHIPIQKNSDRDASEKLKKITSPFVLRRLKTDKSIIADLPEKMEMKVYCTLTREQASLYSATTRDLMDNLRSSEGIRRKGLILSTMSKLKQICNHPLQFLKDNSSAAGRSGKLERLTEMLEEIIDSGERSLIFTQFAEMGEILKNYLQEVFGRSIFFLHGGVPKTKRDYMVKAFQEHLQAPDIFILSLKAGGTGLNLTRASHVFHFDRWWNPAVENQATDRVFRIGQTKNVEVHKFICLGTIEEKIDEMIEQKSDVADNVIGSGEGWITRLSDSELQDIFTLRKEALRD